MTNGVRYARGPRRPRARAASRVSSASAWVAGSDEIVRLIRYNIEHLGIAPHEVCVVGPRWIQLAALTRRLMSALPASLCQKARFSSVSI